jgi:hypothetical protein
LKKRAVSLVLVLVLAFAIAAPAAASSYEADYAADYLYCIGLFKGTGTDDVAIRTMIWTPR